LQHCTGALTVFAGCCGLQAELSALRLNRAGILTQLLGSEVGRWGVTAEEIGLQLKLLTGDTFLSAASISYLGAFTGELLCDMT
jgi:dynein heavy chain